MSGLLLRCVRVRCARMMCGCDARVRVRLCVRSRAWVRLCAGAGACVHGCVRVCVYAYTGEI